MKWFIVLLVSLLVLVLWIPGVAADGAWSINLVAGQNTTIGRVDISVNSDTLTATLQITVPGWCMDTTHFYASNEAPRRAAPGQFTYKHENLNCVTSDVFTVPTPAGSIYVAAHADTRFDPASSGDPLEGTGTLVISADNDSYVTATVTGGINGTYNAWCVDLEHQIYFGQQYTVNVYESSDAPLSIVDVYENLDLINYIINQDYSSLGATVYDIQVAIWLLIDNQTPTGITDVALAIRDDALAKGEGFVPGCGQVMGVIVEPIEQNAQHLLLEVPVTCTTGRPRSETAWAIADWGMAFKTGWGMYFQLV